MEYTTSSIRAEAKAKAEGEIAQIDAVEDDFELEFDRQELSDVLSFVHRS